MVRPALGVAMVDESPRDVRFSEANAALRAELLMLREVSAAELLLPLAVRLAVVTAVRPVVLPVSTVLILLPLLRSESRCVLLAVLVQLRSVSAGAVTGRLSRTNWLTLGLLLTMLFACAL